MLYVALVPKKFPDERPTQPDLSRFPCPACRDRHGNPTGHVVEVEHLPGGRYKSRQIKCTLCEGALTVSRDQLEAWRAD